MVLPSAFACPLLSPPSSTFNTFRFLVSLAYLDKLTSSVAGGSKEREKVKLITAQLKEVLHYFFCFFSFLFCFFSLNRSLILSALLA